MAKQLSLFHELIIKKYCQSPQPNLAICPMCQRVFRRGTGSPQGCSLACRTQIRFWKHVEKTETCWLWTGLRWHGRYGHFKDALRKEQMAHRYAYELLVGAIPKGYQIDHLCRVILCVNPAHLEPVTGTENILRGEGFSAINKRLTHCRRGHAFTVDNTGITPSGARRCRACGRLKYYESRDRKRLARIMDDGNNASAIKQPAET